MPRRFKIDPQRVVHETIDGETILIHLQTGTYYSLTGCGAGIWNLLAAGWTDDDVVGEMQRRHDEGPDAVAEATRALVRDLMQEELIDGVEPNGNHPTAPLDDAPTGQPFATPALAKYTDLQYFLLLDPVHEVEDAGWPHERPVDAV